MRECRKARRRSPGRGGGEGRGEERAGLHLVPGASPSKRNKTNQRGLLVESMSTTESLQALAGACKTWHECTTARSRPVLHHVEQGGQETGRKLARARLQVRELSSLKREKSASGFGVRPARRNPRFRQDTALPSCCHPWERVDPPRPPARWQGTADSLSVLPFPAPSLSHSAVVVVVAPPSLPSLLRNLDLSSVSHLRTRSVAEGARRKR